MIDKLAVLVLADGTVYEGISVGADGECIGEVVFNTAMTGYQEMLTDPSYAGQIITFTSAHVGNTGCNDEDMESYKVWAAGLIMRDYSLLHSNYRAQYTLSEWLKKNGVVAIAGVDTRDLTHKLRNQGAIGACISTHVSDPSKLLAKANSFPGLDGVDLASKVSRKTPESWHQGQGVWATHDSKPQQFHVVAYDFGIKHTILRLLHDKGCHVTLVPAKTSAEEVLTMNPDGLFFSNGPGDPKVCDYAIHAMQTFLNHDIPTFGICLGFQILALACGGTTKKMKFGHHGANHPVVEEGGNKRVFISSQNHSFAVDEDSLPDCLQITHRSLFDGSLQGIKCKNKPIFGFQGHPESGPGPHDLEFLFDEFMHFMRLRMIYKEDIR
ncbi:MAG: glutamine-hydrolyzing carbamoyl-phosphate synthase small subunit [Legionella sp.]|nr:glutamine-hydrolyzing carbamoyl-phosphate synthase small subunit [Legionella sp.]